MEDDFSVRSAEPTSGDTDRVWRCTHSGWFLACPVYIADADTKTPCILPRHVPAAWLDVNVWIQQYIVNWIMCFICPEAVGFMIYLCRDLDVPLDVRVKNTSIQS